MFRDDSASSVVGSSTGGSEYGVDTLVMSASDLGVPSGGKVMLSISGGTADYEEEVEVSDDGMVYFQIPRQRVGSRITVSIAVMRADGSIVRSGSKTMLVTDGCQFSVTLINGSPVVLPATLKSASSINSILTSLGAGSGGAARSFSPSLTPPPEGTETYELSSSGSGVQVLAWLDGETIRYYADGMDACGIIRLPTVSSSMFKDCESLTSIDMSGFDASGVARMDMMFYHCSNLTSVNLSGWDTSKVTDMSWMFSHCSNLRSVDLSGWDTSRVSNMNNMFAFSGIRSVDLSGWDTSKVTNMSQMFYYSSLRSVNLSGWNTSRVTSMSRMFCECSGLTSVDVSGWDTSRVTNMSEMFDNCWRLTSLDLSGWNTSNVTNMSKMFNSCQSLTTIYASSSFVTDNVTDSSSMFDWCYRLVGGAGTAYSSSDEYAAYARIDGGPSAPGYFTAR